MIMVNMEEERVKRVLAIIKDHPEGLSYFDISKEAGLSKDVVRVICISLKEENLIRQSVISSGRGRPITKNYPLFDKPNNSNPSTPIPRKETPALEPPKPSEPTNQDKPRLFRPKINWDDNPNI